MEMAIIEISLHRKLFLRESDTGPGITTTVGKRYKVGTLWACGVGGLETVTIRVSEEVSRVIDEMVRLGIAESRDHALGMIIEAGLPKALELIERRREVEELVNKFLREGLPYERLPTVDDIEEERSR